MKKLMIAACAIAFAAVSQAATMNWGAQYTYDYNGNGDVGEGYRGTATPYLVYIFDNATYDQTALLNAIATGTYQTEWAANKVADATITGGVKASGGFTAQKDSSAFVVKDNTAQAYLVIFNNDSIANADHVYITDVTNGNVPTSGAAGTFKWQNNDRDITNMNGPSGWTAVPEPTSGLLLLLGVAGLALRRRRA